MKKRILKRGFVLALTLIVAMLGQNMLVFADETIEVGDFSVIEDTSNYGKLEVNYYDVEEYPKCEESTLWENYEEYKFYELNTTYTRPAKHGSDNWTKNNTGNIFLDQNDNTIQNAQKITGYIKNKSSETVWIRTFSDDGVRLTIGDMFTSAFKPSTNNKTNGISLEAGEKQPLEIIYFNWGGKGQLSIYALNSSDSAQFIESNEVEESWFATDDSSQEHSVEIRSISVNGTSLDLKDYAFTGEIPYNRNDMMFKPVVENDGTFYYYDGTGFVEYNNESIDFSSTVYFKVMGTHGEFAIYSVDLKEGAPEYTLKWKTSHDEISKKSDESKDVTYEAELYDDLGRIDDANVTYSLDNDTNLTLNDGLVTVSPVVVDGREFTITASSNDIDLICKTKVVLDFKVSYSPLNGTTIEPIYITSGDQIPSSPVVSNDPKLLDGWYIDADKNGVIGDEEIKFNFGNSEYATKVTSDMTLIAKWSDPPANPKTITFDVNGGEPMDESEVSRTGEFGTEVGSLPLPTRAGYDFDGWFALIENERVILTEDSTFDTMIAYAMWTFDPSIEISDAGNGGQKKYFEYGGTELEADINISTGYSGATELSRLLDLDYFIDVIPSLVEDQSLLAALQEELDTENIEYEVVWSLNEGADSTIDPESGLITAALHDESITVTVTLAIKEIESVVTDRVVSSFAPISKTDTLKVAINYTAKQTNDNDEDDEPSNSAPSRTSSTPIVRVSLDADFVELEYGASSEPKLRTFDFTETVKGTDDKRVKWSISSNDYLEIDNEGNVTFIDDVEVPAGLEDFSATVTVKTVDGNKKATAIVVLVEKTPLGAIEFYQPYVFGYPDNTFRPKNSVTRAEVATMFAKILDLNIEYPGSQKFKDVSSDQWYYTYIQAIARTDIFVGEESGNFRPNDAITRAEMATVFAKFWKYLNTTVDSTKVAIKDVDGEHWATEYIYMMYNAGIVTGFPDGSYKPNEPTLREQVVGMINTLIARPENIAPSSKFGDINTSHWAFGNIEAASQIFMQQGNVPIQE